MASESKVRDDPIIFEEGEFEPSRYHELPPDLAKHVHFHGYPSGIPGHRRILTLDYKSPDPRLPDSVMSLPPQLQVMKLDGGELELIDILPSEITDVSAVRNGIRSFVASKSAKLKNVYLNNNLLREVVFDPMASLNTLDLSNNDLSNSPFSCPVRVDQLDLSRNLLTELRLSSSRIRSLNLSQNPWLNPEKLHLPEGLEELRVTNCNLARLPKLPKSLKTLYCAGNQLTTLEGVHPGIKTIYASGNKLTKSSPYRHELLIINSNDFTVLETNGGYVDYIRNDKLKQVIWRVAPKFLPSANKMVISFPLKWIPCRAEYEPLRRHSAAALIQKVYRGHLIRDYVSSSGEWVVAI